MEFYTIQQPMEEAEHTSYLDEIIPRSDYIEKFVRQHSPELRPVYKHAVGQLPRFQRPIRRRLKADETRVKLHQSFSMTTMPAVGLRGGLDAPELSSSSSPVTIVTPASSSAGTPWSTSGRVEELFGDDAVYNWENTENYLPVDDIVAPKLEPIDDFDMDSLYEIDDTPMRTVTTQPSVVETPIKRPRGRPRINPKRSPEGMAKVHKARSKTGCGTCRLRKKKCDEGKPTCLNCKKNGVECVGYRPLVRWKSGKEKKAEEEAKKRESEAAQRRGPYLEVDPIPLPYIFLGVETEPDRIFFQYYIDPLSLIYTVEGETGAGSVESSFRTLFLPEAQGHKGLMHSILSLASRHIDYTSPYGQQILREHPNVKLSELQERSDYHYMAARAELRKGVARAYDDSQQAISKRERDDNISATHLQVVCRIVETLNEDKPDGEHRLHLKHSQDLPDVKHKPEQQRFLDQFYGYHIFADQIISLSPVHFHHEFNEQWNLPGTILDRDAVTLLGVCDSNFVHMSKITNLRNQIRDNFAAGIEPVVGYPTLHKYAEIHAGIQAWEPVWPAGDPRELNGRIYQNMLFIYLLRTIYPPRNSDGWNVNPRIIEAVDRAIVYLGLIGPNSRYQTSLLAPTFVIGCAAFEPAQRMKIRETITVIKAYMNLKNSMLCLRVLEEVWRLMDLKDERSWDWQMVAKLMEMDFLAT